MTRNTNNKNRVKLLATIIAMMVFSVGAIIVFNEDSEGSAVTTYGDDGAVKRGDIALDNATISFVKDDGTEWSYKNGNTTPLTNTNLGNKDLTITKTNGKTISITGYLENQDRSAGIGAQFAATGAPAGYDYAIIFNLADVVDANGDYGFGADGSPVYIQYINSQGTWKTLTKTGNTSTQLVYINTERFSTTYYITASQYADADAAVADTDAKKLTVNFDFKFVDNSNGILAYSDGSAIKRGDLITDNATVSFIKNDGMEYSYTNGNSIALTNSNLGNTKLSITKNSGTEITISGYLQKQNRTTGIGAEFANTGAPEGYDYAIILNLADVVDANGDYGFGASGSSVYIQYINSQGTWKTLTKTGGTSTQLIYINSERLTTTYYITASQYTDATEAAADEDAKTLTINFDFGLTSAATSSSDLSTIIASDDARLAENVEITGPFDGNGNTIYVDDSTLTFTSSTVTNTTIGGADGSSITIASATGTFSVRSGSVIIDGIINSGSINAVSGSVLVKGTINGNVTITVADSENATITLDNGLVINGNLTINNSSNATDNTSLRVQILDGSTVTLGNNAKLTVNKGVVNVIGALQGTSGTFKAENGTEVYVDSGAIITPILEADDDSQFFLGEAMKEVHISKDIISNSTWTSQQKVYIDSSITIYSGATLSIAGELEVSEGMKITVMSGGHLIVNGVNAVAIVDGEIIIQGTDGFQFTGKKLTVNGTITEKSVTGTTPSMSIAGETEINGTVSILVNSTATFTRGVTINADGKLEVAGTISGVVEKNYGTVEMNGTVGSSFNIKMQAGGIVDIKSVKESMTVTDLGLIFKKDLKVDNVNYTANSITLTNIRAVGVTSSISTYTDDNGDKVYVNDMFITGTAASVKDTTGTISITAGIVQVKDNFDLGKIELGVSEDATLDVSGNMLIVPALDDFKGITGEGTLVVTGLLKSIDDLTGSGMISHISAVSYEKKEADTTYYYYTNLADAIASGSDELKVLGDITLTKDTVIPAGIDVDAGSKKITVGTVKDDEVTLTVTKGATLNAGTIDVIGTFVIEDTNDVTCNNIFSDTSSLGESDALYTNIYKALDMAESGDVVKITKKAAMGETTAEVTLTKNATVKEGVTLEVPVNKILNVKEGYMLTIDGKLYLNNGELGAVKADGTDGTFGTVVSERNAVTGVTTEYAVVKVTGVTESYDKLTYSTYKIAGAQYEANGKYYLTTVENSVNAISTADEQTVNIVGTNDVDTVIFIGTEDKDVTINVEANADLTVTTMKVTFGKIVFASGAKSAGTFGNDVGTITLKNTKFDSSTTIENKMVDDVSVVTINGSVLSRDSTDNYKPEMTFNGKVSIIKAELKFDGTYVGTTSSATKGSVIVSEDSILAITGTNGDLDLTSATLTITGRVVVDDNATITSTIDATIEGTLDVMEKTTKKAAAGDVAFGNLYIGGDLKTTVGATAAVNGKVSASTGVYLFPGATVSGDLKDILDDAPYTEFYVEDNLWMTAYKTGSNIEIVKWDSTNSVSKNVIAPKLSEKQFLNWQKVYSGKLVDVKTSSTSQDSIFVGNISKLYALIDYNVYDVSVYACEGIDNVYIDGVIIEGMSITGSFSAAVTAGEHTISYTLTNGYSGTATMYIGDKKVDGMKFTASGDFGSGTEYMIKLQGIEKSGYVPESPDVPTPVEPAKDDSMGITEYLLIVLVILAAILVVVVAIRMMRS